MTDFFDDNFCDDIKHIVATVPHFDLGFNKEGYGYCNPDLYKDLENPVDIYYSFKPYNAALMHQGLIDSKGQEIIFTADEVSKMSAKDLVKLNNNLKAKHQYEAMNKDLVKGIKEFFLDIEAIANVKFTESKNLSKDSINIVISGIDKSSSLIPASNIAFAGHPVDEFSGSLIYIRDVNDKVSPQEVLKDTKHEILHGLCEDHPSFSNVKKEQQYRSLVEDETTSSLVRDCLQGDAMTKAAPKCARKVDFSMSDMSKMVPFLRCNADLIDKSCIHTPTMLSPIDVKHLQYVFGESKKEEDPTDFRKRFVYKYQTFTLNFGL